MVGLGRLPGYCEGDEVVNLDDYGHLDEVEEGLADVVLLDRKMPGMSGEEVLQEIKRIQPETQVVILTGHGTVDTAIQGMKLGAFDYLTKPCELETLLTKIQQAARIRRSDR